MTHSWLAGSTNLLLGTVHRDLLFSLRPGKLELSLLLRKFRIGLLQVEQALDDLWFGHLQVTIPGPFDITLRVDAQGTSQNLGFCRLNCPFARLGCPIGCTVLAVVRMGLLVFQQGRLLDPPALGINLRTLTTDSLNRDWLLLIDELIDAALDQAYRAFALLLIVLLEPGMRVSGVGPFLVRFEVQVDRFHQLCIPQ